eukprot:6209646-Pleurochrysis_carterae.AAC.2
MTSTWLSARERAPSSELPVQVEALELTDGGGGGDGSDDGGGNGSVYGDGSYGGDVAPDEGCCC